MTNTNHTSTRQNLPTETPLSRRRAIASGLAAGAAFTAPTVISHGVVPAFGSAATTLSVDSACGPIDAIPRQGGPGNVWNPEAERCSGEGYATEVVGVVESGFEVIVTQLGGSTCYLSSVTLDCDGSPVTTTYPAGTLSSGTLTCAGGASGLLTYVVTC